MYDAATYKYFRHSFLNKIFGVCFLYYYFTKFLLEKNLTWWNIQHFCTLKKISPLCYYTAKLGLTMTCTECLLFNFKERSL